MAVFSKPTREQMTSPDKMQRDLNIPFKKFVASIGGRMGISPNPEIFTPDFAIYQNLLLEIKNHINNTPRVYENEKFKEVRKSYDDLQLKKDLEKETAKKNYEEDLIKVGKQKAEEHYNQRIAEITLDYDDRVTEILVVFAAAAIIGIIVFANPAVCRLAITLLANS
ncbi:23572_t:CDS:1 [Cetraspora pellucida]|uniref:23572_t:CDS:1 n=1 Tax=Cetraspora pellucida TaxID=1433469 RepID=A0A9N9JPP6_9GLOM|nr:23572_t:CDS:1 [Cetraspora pellucida]